MPTTSLPKPAPSAQTQRATQASSAAPSQTSTNPLASLAEKYKDLPFDDSRVLKYGEKGSDSLRQIAQEIRMVDSDVRAVIREMADIMYNAHGVGLAAPQVGRSIKLLTYDAGNGLQTLINPTLLKQKGEQYDPEEGCLSIPGLRGVVRRAQEIQVRALDGEGRPVKLRVSGLEARIILHEMDHLEGILFVDRADPATLHMLPQRPDGSYIEETEDAPAA